MHAGKRAISSEQATNDVLPGRYKLHHCYNASDKKCGCRRPHAKPPTRGAEHERPDHVHAPRENIASAGNVRRSGRAKKHVDYTEEVSEARGNRERASSSAAEREKYKVPQCKAHGRDAQAGMACVMAQLRQASKDAGLALEIIQEWPIAVGGSGTNGVDRKNSKARRGRQKSKHSGEFAGGRLHKVDLVLAKYENQRYVAVAGLEVQGTSHGTTAVQQFDKTKSEEAGFRILSIAADAEKEDMLLEVQLLLQECKLV